MMKQHPLQTELRPRDWLVAIAERTGAFSLLDTPIPRNTSPAESLREWDDFVTIRPKGLEQSITLLVECKSQLQPRHVVDLARQLETCRTPEADRTKAILAAPFVSSRTAELCQGHGIGYFDGAGNCHIALPAFFLHVEGRPNIAPETRQAENLFARQSSRILRILLERPEHPWRTEPLAQEAHVSLGLISRVKQRLVRDAYATDTPLGIQLRDPIRLLNAWSQSYNNASRIVMVYSFADAPTLERKILQWGAEHDVLCALTEFSGASKIAPMVRNKKMTVRILETPGRDVVRPLLRDLELKEVDSGPTAVLWIDSDDSVFYNAAPSDGTMIVSPIQLYLDLSKNPARGKEAADEILRRHILPRFPDSYALSA